MMCQGIKPLSDADCIIPPHPCSREERPPTFFSNLEYFINQHIKIIQWHRMGRTGTIWLINDIDLWHADVCLLWKFINENWK